MDKRKKLRYGALLFVLAAGVAAAGAFGGDDAFTVCVSVLAVVYLVALAGNVRWAYLAGAAYAVLYAAVCFLAGLYAGAVFHLFALAPVTVFRFARWGGQAAGIRRLRISGWLAALAAAGALFTALYAVFRAARDAQPALDSLVFAVSLIAVFLMLKNYRELWVFNLLGTALTIAVWSVQYATTGDGLSVVVVQSIVAAVNVIGFVGWCRAARAVSGDRLPEKNN